MSGWQRMIPVQPGDDAVTARAYEIKGRTMIKLRVPVSVAGTYDWEEGDEFEVYLDAHGGRLQLKQVQAGDVVAKSYSRGGPVKALNVSLAMLALDGLFKKQRVEHEKINDALVITLPVTARQASA